MLSCLSCLYLCTCITDTHTELAAADMHHPRPEMSQQAAVKVTGDRSHTKPPVDADRLQVKCPSDVILQGQHQLMSRNGDVTTASHSENIQKPLHSNSPGEY